MPITGINSKVDLCLQDNPSELNLAQVTGVSGTTTYCSVANTSVLPSAANNKGKWVYVEDIAAYRFSNGISWSKNYNTSIGTLTSQLFFAGVNNSGRFGTGNTINSNTPVQEVCSDITWTHISVGIAGSQAIKSDGTMWGWGSNQYGVIGDNTSSAKCVPTQEITSSTNWCCQHLSRQTPALGIKTDGTLWGWGATSGDGTTVWRSSPVQEITSSCWIKVGGNMNSVAAIKSDGTLWGWGGNGYGNVGDGTTTNRSSPVQEATSSSNWCFVSRHGELNQFAIKTDGTMYAWGFNCCGSLANGSANRCSIPTQENCNATNWCQASSAQRNSYAIKTDGTMWGVGWSGYGANATNEGTHYSFVQEFNSSTDWLETGAHLNFGGGGIKTNGTLWMWGWNLCGLWGFSTPGTSCGFPIQESPALTDYSCIAMHACISARIRCVPKGFNEP